jgi:hypothetical protein
MFQMARFLLPRALESSFEPASRRLGNRVQAGFHKRSRRASVLTRMINLRMAAARASFDSLPLSRRRQWKILIAGLHRKALSVAM